MLSNKIIITKAIVHNKICCESHPIFYNLFHKLRPPVHLCLHEQERKDIWLPKTSQVCTDSKDVIILCAVDATF